MSSHQIVSAEQRTWARVAGVMFLAHFALEFGGDYVTIIAQGGAPFAETSRYVVEHTTLWRTALLSVGLGWVSIAFLAFALHVVLEPVNRRLSQLALALRVSGAFLGGATLMLRVAKTGISLATTTETFSTDQFVRLSAFTQQGINSGIYLSWIFMGLGSTIFFLLFRRSGYMPRALADYCMFASLLLVAVPMVSWVFPQIAGPLKGVLLLSLLSEFAAAWWLLARGPRDTAIRQ